MLINATQLEELRIAFVDGQKLYDLNIGSLNNEQKKSNIYKGKVIRIEPSLEAAFIDYGSYKHGFLPFKEISNEYFSNKNINTMHYNIKDILKKGQECIVQINKEERKSKGATLTTFISLAGSYLILMPNSPGIEGISRKIAGEARRNLKKLLLLLNVPDGMGLIVRTAGIGQSIQTLQLDLNFHLKCWNRIKKQAKINSAPFLIHQEGNIIIRALRDYLCKDIGEILIDNLTILNCVYQYISFLRRFDFKNKIKLYTGDSSLFSHYQIESQIDSIFQRQVKLPSGGSIVIDTVEALTAIDINSSRSTQGIDAEETALSTNLEAVDEISRQLRLRDLGGLIVIDFIDMMISDNKKLVLRRLRNIIRQDRARINIGSISKFGLLEMSRQRLNSSIGESNYYVCPQCNGIGNIRDNKSLSLSILRLIEREALKDNTYIVYVIVPLEIAYYLLNEKREVVNSIEKRQNGGRTIIVPHDIMKTPNYFIVRTKRGEKIRSIDYVLAKYNKSLDSR